MNRNGHGRSMDVGRFLSVHHRHVEPMLAVVVEEDGVDDLLIRSGEIEGSVRDGEESFDIRDLLLDETD